jgi:hypothetical protein
MKRYGLAPKGSIRGRGGPPPGRQRCSEDWIITAAAPTGSRFNGGWIWSDYKGDRGSASAVPAAHPPLRRIERPATITLCGLLVVVRELLVAHGLKGETG